MCLIFDSFQSIGEAERVAAAISQRFKLRTDVWADQDSMQTEFSWDHPHPAGRLTDVFPWKLNAPILLVERTHWHERRLQQEGEIADAVIELGGNFAGT
jgi:hypothetical protein